MDLLGNDTNLPITELELRAAIRERIQAVREQVNGCKTAEFRNQRRAVRRPFVYAQRIAAFDGQMPDLSSFFEVKCRDISTSGFSFHADAAPTFTRLVVELGVPPQVIYVQAEIAHVRPGANDKFVVGCRFTGRAI